MEKKMVNWGPWPELPEELLDLITKSLGAIDYLMFGCVCRAWRLYVATYRKEFMASQPPLYFFLSKRANKVCYFYGIFDHRLYKAILPNLKGKSCSGLTCGSSDCNWTTYDYSDQFKATFRGRIPLIVDGVVFKGKIYVLTIDADIGVLNLNSHPYVTLLEVKRDRLRLFRKGQQLLRYEEHLLMLCIANYKEYQVYELDFLKMEWVPMQNYGDQTLFWSFEMGLGFCNITRWKDSQQPSYCIYDVTKRFSHNYNLHFWDRRRPQCIPITCRTYLPKASLGIPFWYFPHLSCSVDSLSDE
ncbi:F-box protein At3g56470-like [Fagus crenata]